VTSPMTAPSLTTGIPSNLCSSIFSATLMPSSSGSAVITLPAGVMAEAAVVMSQRFCGTFRMFSMSTTPWNLPSVATTKLRYRLGWM
jgi:hypothetical protein